MGNLLNPIALRLNYNKFWKFNWTSISRKNYTYLIINDLTLYKFINFFSFFFKLLEKQRVCFSYNLKIYKKSNNILKIFIFFFPTPFHYQLLKLKTIETIIFHIIKRFKLQLKLIFGFLRNSVDFDFFSSYNLFFKKINKKNKYNKKRKLFLKKKKLTRLNLNYSLKQFKNLKITLKKKKKKYFNIIKYFFFFNWYFLKRFYKYFKNLKKKLLKAKIFKFISFFKFLDLIFFFKKKLNLKKKKEMNLKIFAFNKKKNKLTKKVFFDLFLIEKLFFHKMKKKKFLKKSFFFFHFMKKYYFLLIYFFFFNSLLYLNLKKIRNIYNLSIISIFSYFVNKINKEKKDLEIILVPYKLKRPNDLNCNLKKNFKNLLNFFFFLKNYSRIKFFFFSKKNNNNFLILKKNNNNNFLKLLCKFILKKTHLFFLKIKKKTKKFFFRILNLILKKIKKNFFLFFLKLNFLNKFNNNSKVLLKNIIYTYKKYKTYINFLFQKKKFLSKEKKIKKKIEEKEKSIYKYKYLIFNSRFLMFFFKKKFKKKPFEIIQIIAKIAKILKKKKEINGFKIKLKGRFSKKTRTNKFAYKFGTMLPNTLECYLDYTEDVFFSKYGLYSIKIWLYIKKNEKIFFLNNLLKREIIKLNLNKI